MTDNNVNIQQHFLSYDSKEMQALPEEVEHRSFLRDMTGEVYEALAKEEQQNGDLYLLHEADE